MTAQGNVPRRLPKYCIEDTDRHGKVRVYLRLPGQRKVSLPGSPWSEEFMVAYATGLGRDRQATVQATGERSLGRHA